ncbi:MAG: hypothetical protein ACOYN5_05390 [Bacteroidales bacterium]
MKTKTHFQKLIATSRLTSLFAWLLIAIPLAAFPAEKTGWPKLIETSEAEITIYQPEPESLNGAEISLRSAISVKPYDTKKMVFGAIWINATIVSDRDSRMVSLTNIKIPIIRFSDALSDEESQRLKRFLESELPKQDLEIPIDVLVATFDDAGTVKTENFDNTPPEIIVSYKPAILLFIDGEVVYEDLKDYPLKRVMNTPFALFFDPAKKQYYLFEEGNWYSSAADLKRFSLQKNVSDDLSRIQSVIEKSMEEAENQEDAQQRGEDATAIESQKTEATEEIVPDIIVRFVSSELIEIDGQPDFKPVKNTNLLFVANTRSDLFMDIASQRYFVLISGRWYSSLDLKGKWAYVSANELPGDFALIQEGSDQDAVLASVPGTQASKEAILDNQIPQTAEIDRATATTNVDYDGSPKFEKVEGTSMYYAVNTSQTVLRLNGTFYAVDNGVWFESSSANGPWTVATTRPTEVENINPSSPVYNVKYVYIYDVSPTIVYVGYTPGYYGSYIYGPTIVYGTGYRYHSWYGNVYYPRPVTYGFHMYYNPWTGWNLGMSVTYGGWMHIHHHHHGYHGGGWWGPQAYRPPYYRPYHGHYHNHHDYRKGGYYGHRSSNEGSSYRPSNSRESNIYTGSRPGVRPSVRPSNDPARGSRPTKESKPNNVYTDKSGNVYQKTNRGWQERSENDWKKVDERPQNRPVKKEDARPEKRPDARPADEKRPPMKDVRPEPVRKEQPKARPAEERKTTSFDKPKMEKQNQNRDRGTNRYENYQKYSEPKSKPVAPKRDDNKKASTKTTQPVNKKTKR